MSKRFLLILMLSLTFLPVHAAEQAVIIRTSSVHAKADSQSESIGSLPAGVTVSVFSRQGGWKEIFSEDRNLTGWVRSYQVREGIVETGTDASESDSRGFLAGLAAFSRRASGFFGGSDDDTTNSRTATIGVRGLSETDIKNAQPDINELKKMHSFSSNKTRMKAFATGGGLSSQKVRHLKSK